MQLSLLLDLVLSLALHLDPPQVHSHAHGDSSLAKGAGSQEVGLLLLEFLSRFDQIIVSQDIAV